MSIPSITPNTKPISVGGKEFLLRKFRVVDFPELRKAVEKVLTVLATNAAANDAGKDYALLTQAFPETCIVMVCGSTAPSTFIHTLDHVEFRNLLASVMEHNQDFFVLAATEMAAKNEIERAKQEAQTTDGTLFQASSVA